MYYAAAWVSQPSSSKFRRGTVPVHNLVCSVRSVAHISSWFWTKNCPRPMRCAATFSPSFGSYRWLVLHWQMLTLYRPASLALMATV